MEQQPLYNEAHHNNNCELSPLGDQAHPPRGGVWGGGKQVAFFSVGGSRTTKQEQQPLHNEAQHNNN